MASHRECRHRKVPTHLKSVSVVAPTAMAADALATTVFVMGPDNGIPFIDSLPQCAALLVDDHGTQWRSGRWRSSLPPDRKEGQT